MHAPQRGVWSDQESFERLAAHVLNDAQRRTVLAHGCFDLLHLGHIRHLEEARRQGDRLVVSVTDDRFVGKGMGRPHFSTAERVEALRALACVDEVIVSEAADSLAVIEHIKPAVYVKGIDYKDETMAAERAAVEQYGGRIHITTTAKQSSSRLINAEKFPTDTLVYLDRCRAAGFFANIERAFAAADKLSLCFVGETIIDEYRYVSALGRPAKEFILAGVEIGSEEFEGGVWAASHHAEWPKVDVITSRANAIRKTRFIEGAGTRKVFETYSARSVELAESARDSLQVRMISAMAKCDVAIVLDFGHGLLGPQERHFVETAKFLAVNAQTNAGNFGFNPVTRYSHADYVCVDDPEARLASGMSDASIEDVIRYGLAARINSPRITVTNGRNGATAFDRNGSGTRVAHVPAFAFGGVDTMGAGDAFLAVSAPLLAAGLDVEAAAFAGSVAGAIKVSIVGHRRHVGRAELMQTIEALLK
jgi:rfaE bifunctional protein nucleotidyltransferase chain/domain